VPATSGSAVTRPAPRRESRLCKQLRKHAQEVCFPYLASHKALAPVAQDAAFAIVGSVATGFCRAGSDIDIAVIAPDRSYRLVRRRVPGLTQRWRSGRPAEEIIGGRQLHWYAVSTTDVRRALLCHNDGAMYAYGTARILQDPGARLARLLARYGPHVADVRAARIAGKLDMLQRRAGVLSHMHCNRLVVAQVALEALTLSFKAAALLDGAEGFRKDLEALVSKGRVGRALMLYFLQVLAGVGSLGEAARVTQRLVARRVSRPLAEMIETLEREARSQGLRTGLPRPDPRHAEPQPSPAMLWQQRAEWQARQR